MQITKYIDQNSQENMAYQNFQYEIMISKSLYVSLDVPVKGGGGGRRRGERRRRWKQEKSRAPALLLGTESKPSRSQGEIRKGARPEGPSSCLAVSPWGSPLVFQGWNWPCLWARCWQCWALIVAKAPSEGRKSEQTGECQQVQSVEENTFQHGMDGLWPSSRLSLE